MTSPPIKYKPTWISGSEPVIEADHLAFRYRMADGTGRAWTLDGLSFHIGAGEIFGIVGPNGAGKSSLLKVIAGLMPPNTGQIRLNGKPLGQLTRQHIAQMVAVVPQEYVPVFPFTVAETVLMGRFPHRPSRWWSLGIENDTTHDLSCAHQAMHETDVLSLSDRVVSDLSGGERQRVMIARALAQEPSVLLLDEPTAFLDIHHQIEVCSLINRLRSERQLTVVLASHDLNAASQYCDRVLVLHDGQLSRIGPPQDTITADVLRMVYGCDVVVDAHPQTGRPRVTIPISNGHV